MNKKTVLLVGGGIAALCICGCIALMGLGLVGGLGGIGLTQPIADVGEKFMLSLKNGEYEMAFGLCHPSLQQELGSAQGLKQTIERGNAQPIQWSFNSRNIENDQGRMEGTVTMRGGAGTVTLEFAKSGSEWKVSGFDLSAK